MAFPRQLTIQVRKRQLKDIYGSDIIFTGVNPMSIASTMATEDTTWHDFTDFVSGLDKLELDWSAEINDFGVVTVGEFNPKKGVSGTLSFERDAHQFLKAHLVENVAAALNQIEVQITDTRIGRYVGYVIKAAQLSWCEFNALCVFDLNLKQIEDYTNCIQRTLIADNWNGWFQDEPVDISLGGIPKKHPRFSYCIEIRPNWTLVLQWILTSILALLYVIIFTVFYPVLLIIYGIVLAINVIIDVINLIIDAVNTLPGVSIDPVPHISMDPPPTPGDIVDVWAIAMIEGAGCGREHPAPLIRDYILNVCNKCGVQVTATTADVFFSPVLTVIKSDGIVYNDPNPYYNACYLFPQVYRGIRRFNTINLLTGFTNPNTTQFYQPGNAPLLALDMFLDELRKPFNQQWRIIEDTAGVPFLYIKRKDWFINEPPLYDFSIGGADRSKLVEGICYEPQDFTVPASCLPIYEDDPSDKCGVEAELFYNGKAISFNQSIINPLFKGVLDKKSGFAAAHFNCDGTTTNYMYDALQIIYTIPGLNIVLTPILSSVGSMMEQYGNYSLLLQTETVSLPKILIWDGFPDNPGDPTYINAHAMRESVVIGGSTFTIGKSAYPGVFAGITVPDINTLYPSQIPPATSGIVAYPSTIPDATPWIVNHPPHTLVLGLASILPTTGKYYIKDFLFSTVFEAPAILVNWPMYFEPHYLNTLWDYFHWIDDPYKNPRLHKNWSLKIPLCKEDIEKLQLTISSNQQKLLASVLLDTTFYNKGVITGITVHYDTGDENGQGQYIMLKGIV